MEIYLRASSSAYIAIAGLNRMLDDGKKAQAVALLKSTAKKIWKQAAILLNI